MEQQQRGYNEIVSVIIDKLDEKMQSHIKESVARLSQRLDTIEDLISSRSDHALDGVSNVVFSIFNMLHHIWPPMSLAEKN